RTVRGRASPVQLLGGRHGGVRVGGGGLVALLCLPPLRAAARGGVGRHRHGNRAGGRGEHARRSRGDRWRTVPRIRNRARPLAACGGPPRPAPPAPPPCYFPAPGRST